MSDPQPPVRGRRTAPARQSAKPPQGQSPPQTVPSLLIVSSQPAPPAAPAPAPATGTRGSAVSATSSSTQGPGKLRGPPLELHTEQLRATTISEAHQPNEDKEPHERSTGGSEQDRIIKMEPAEDEDAHHSNEDKEPHERSTGGSEQDRIIKMEPAEDDDDDDMCSVEHSSYARCMRNQRLMNEIFSDSVPDVPEVPDVCTVVTTSGMHHVQCTVESLENHQKKMESEVEQLIVKFETTKRKFNETSDAFQEEIQKYCKRAVDDDFFNVMVEKELKRLRNERSSSVNNGNSNNNGPLEEVKKETDQPVITPPDDSSPAADIFPADSVFPDEYCKGAVDDDFFNDMVEKEYERLRKERSSNVINYDCNNNVPLEEVKKETEQLFITHLDNWSPNAADIFPADSVSLMRL